MVIRRNNLKPNEYTKFMSNGYLIEVIPDFTKGDKHPDITISMVEAIRLANCYSTPGAFCERHFFKIPTADLSSGKPITSNVVHEYTSNRDLTVSFTGKVWAHRKCTSGNLEITIIEKEDEAHGNCDD